MNTILQFKYTLHQYDMKQNTPIFYCDIVYYLCLNVKKPSQSSEKETVLILQYILLCYFILIVYSYMIIN